MQGKIRAFGHENGTKAVRTTVENCARLGINTLHYMLFQLKTGSAKIRSKDPYASVDFFIKKGNEHPPKQYQIECHWEHQYPLKKYTMSYCMSLKPQNQVRMTLNLALSYGSRDELTHAVKKIGEKIKNDIISTEKIDESVINQHLYTRNLQTLIYS